MTTDSGIHGLGFLGIRNFTARLEPGECFFVGEGGGFTESEPGVGIRPLIWNSSVDSWG